MSNTELRMRFEEEKSRWEIERLLLQQELGALLALVYFRAGQVLEGTILATWKMSLVAVINAYHQKCQAIHSIFALGQQYFRAHDSFTLV